MPHHNRAILAQLTPAERAFFEREPARSWLAQMRGKLRALSVQEGAKLLRENMKGLAPRPPAKPRRDIKPANTKPAAPPISRPAVRIHERPAGSFTTPTIEKTVERQAPVMAGLAASDAAPSSAAKPSTLTDAPQRDPDRDDARLDAK